MSHNKQNDCAWGSFPAHWELGSTFTWLSQLTEIKNSAPSATLHPLFAMQRLNTPTGMTRAGLAAFYFVIRLGDFVTTSLEKSSISLYYIIISSISLY